MSKAECIECGRRIGVYQRRLQKRLNDWDRVLADLQAAAKRIAELAAQDVPVQTGRMH
jgi:hypothetical protein